MPQLEVVLAAIRMKSFALVGKAPSEAQFSYEIALGSIVLAQGCIVVVGATGKRGGFVEVEWGSAEVVGLAHGAEVATAVMIA